MKTDDDNHSSQEEQGFYKPTIKVQNPDQKHEVHKSIVAPIEFTANDLITHSRPIDYLPRVLANTPLLQTVQEPPYKTQAQAEQLVISKRQKIKKCKYLSLRDKYLNNALFKLVYSKLDPNDSYNSYIFSLNNTTDYNPNNYIPPLKHLSLSDSPFQSRFESGNLLYAYLSTQSKSEQYDLLLQNDTNTRGYNQWFYFTFTSQKTGSVRFNIVNMIKKHTLFEQGVRPVGWFKGDVRGWQPIGTNVDYQKSYINRELIQNSLSSHSYYTLSFNVEFSQMGQTVYLALNYPYTYSRLVSFIKQVQETASPQLQVNKEIICYSISNNVIPCLRIAHRQYQKQGKKIILMGRQHPGETAGSFVLESCLRALLKQSVLLRNYELIVVPMINVDGVIYGNFRTNFAGFDLNRQWVEPDRWLHPQIYYITRFISGLSKISFVLDFHSHSKKYNSFIYACTGEMISHFRLFPYICGKVCPNFSIKDCAYNITPDKERTARVKLFRQINKPQIFTLQTSFFGYQDTNSKKYRFRVKDLQQIGKGIAASLVLYLCNRKQVQQYEKQVKDKEYLFDQWSFQNKQDIDSQSNPSEDELTPVERKQKVLAEVDSKKMNRRNKPKKKKTEKQPRAPQSIFNFKIRNAQPKNEEVAKIIPVKPKSPARKKTQIEKVNKVKLEHGNAKKKEKMMSIDASPKRTIEAVTPVLPINQTKTSKFHSASESKVIQPVQAPAIPSNLFNKSNYYAQMQEKLQGRENRSNLHQKTQSLQINNLKKQMSSNGSTMDVLRKLMISEDDHPYKETLPAGGHLHREKIYVIRQNRVINSMTRTNQIELKKHLEQQIGNRTEALRNCQKKMRQMSINEPILPHNTDSLIEPRAPGTKSLYSALKAYKFPTIKIDRRTDHFIF